MKKEDKEVVVVIINDHMVATPKARVEVLRALRAKVEGMEDRKVKDELKRKTINIVVVEKEDVTKIAIWKWIQFNI